MLQKPFALSRLWGPVPRQVSGVCAYAIPSPPRVIAITAMRPRIVMVFVFICCFTEVSIHKVLIIGFSRLNPTLSQITPKSLQNPTRVQQRNFNINNTEDFDYP